MAELTHMQIYEGIAAAIRSAFPHTEIFCGKTLQQVRPGTFNVIPVATRPVEKLRDRYRFSDTFDVIYYPLEGDLNADCLRIATDLQLIFQTVTTPSGAKLHPALGFTCEIVDDVLHCLLRFEYHAFARRVHVDEEGNETPYNIHGELDDTDLMRILDLRLPPNPEKENRYGKETE